MDTTEADKSTTQTPPEALPQRERKKRNRVGDAEAGDETASEEAARASSVGDSARATAATGEESSIVRSPWTMERCAFSP